MAVKGSDSVIYLIGGANPDLQSLDRAIVGFGILGQRLHRLVSRDSAATVVFDDTPGISGKLQQMPFADYGTTGIRDCWFIVGLGYKHLPVRREIIETLKTTRRMLPSLIHRGSCIDETAIVGCGTFINVGVCIADGSHIGDGSILESGCTIAHDSTVGTASFIGPGAMICGHVSIGSGVFIGAGSVIRNGIKIGDNATIGMGTVITRDIGKSEAWLGNPSRKLQHGLRLS